jgi:hypothetical protein
MIVTGRESLIYSVELVIEDSMFRSYEEHRTAASSQAAALTTYGGKGCSPTYGGGANVSPLQGETCLYPYRIETGELESR